MSGLYQSTINLTDAANLWNSGTPDLTETPEYRAYAAATLALIADKPMTIAEIKRAQGKGYKVEWVADIVQPHEVPFTYPARYHNPPTKPVPVIPYDKSLRLKPRDLTKPTVNLAKASGD